MVDRRVADDDSLTALIEADDAAERRRVLDSSDVLRRAEAVHQLMAQVNRLLRVDLERAGQMAELTLWLAEELNDDDGRGLGHRALGHIRLFSRDYPGALAEYERALELFRGSGNDAEAAGTASPAAYALTRVGRFDEAQELAGSARDTFDRLGDRLRQARVENTLAHITFRRDRYHEAIGHHCEALRHFREAGGRPPDIAGSLRNIAVCYQAVNDFEAAMAAYEEAAELSERHGLSLEAMEVAYNVAYLYYLRGEYTEALRRFDAARERALEQGDREHAALCDLDQAEIYLELNLHGEAGRLAAAAREGFEQLGMGYEVAKAESFQALAEYRRGRLDSARDLLSAAAAGFREQENRAWEAMTRLQSALMLQDQGSLDAAGDEAGAALEAFVELDLPSKTALSEIVLARLDLAGGRLDDAAERAAAALERVTALGTPALESQAHLVRGQAAERRGDGPAALAAYRRAHAGLERLRGQLQADEIRVAFLRDKRAIYESLFTLTLAGGDDPANRKEAWAWAERAKSRSLADLLAFGAAALPATAAADELVAEIRKRREELNWQYRQIDQEEMRGREHSLERIERLRSVAGASERRLLRDLRTLQNRDPDYRSLQDPVGVDLEAVRADLGEDVLLLEYFIARGTVYGFLIGSDRLECRELAAERTVRDLHRRLLHQLAKMRTPGVYQDPLAEFARHATLTLLQRLHAGLVAPFADRLDRRRLVIVPHDFLHFVPFHALEGGDGPLIDRHAVSYAPSATVLHLTGRRTAASEERSLVLGVPDERAPLIAEEARAVAETLPGATLLLGEEATQENLVRLGERCRWLHVATHGLHRRDNPMFSALKLSSGRLSLFDLYGLRLNAELAVLSGCGTGLSEVQGTDELIGLTRGLLYAGARSLLVTLWDVNDESTTLFMRLFYGHLVAGETPAEALRAASRELRERHDHPYYWAPFVLVGPPANDPPKN